MAKYDSMDSFYEAMSPEQTKAIKRFVRQIKKSFPKLELVVAWNQPMFKLDGKYIVGLMPTKNYINLVTLTDESVVHFAKRLKDYHHANRTIALPFDWDIDEALLSDIIKFRIKEANK